MNRGVLKVVEPSKGHRSQTGREHSAHQSVIAKVESHALFKMADRSDGIDHANVNYVVVGGGGGKTFLIGVLSLFLSKRESVIFG